MKPCKAASPSPAPTKLKEECERPRMPKRSRQRSSYAVVIVVGVWGGKRRFVSAWKVGIGPDGVAAGASTWEDTRPVELL